MSRGGHDLSHFAQHNLTEAQFEEILRKNDEVDTQIHKISVDGGYLRIKVEDGVPTITYMSDSGVYLVEMLSTNSLRFLNIKRG